jgi:hypothetical protein
MGRAPHLFLALESWFFLKTLLIQTNDVSNSLDNFKELCRRFILVLPAKPRKKEEYKLGSWNMLYFMVFHYLS